MVLVGGILLAAERDGLPVDEAADVVHVSMGVVARDAAREPENVAGGEVLPKDSFVISPVDGSKI